jgi:hypothetical protein
MIIRFKKTKGETKGFTQISNTTLQDKKLSFMAKGLLNYLLSKPDNWKPNIKDLVKHGNESRRAILSAYRELQENGYMKIERIRGENYKISQVEYTIFEESQDENFYNPRKAFKDSTGQDKGNDKPKSTSETEEGQKPKSTSETEDCSPQNEPLKDSTGQALNPQKPKSQKPKSQKPKSTSETDNNNDYNNTVEKTPPGKDKNNNNTLTPRASALPLSKEGAENSNKNIISSSGDFILYPSFSEQLISGLDYYENIIEDPKQKQKWKYFIEILNAYGLRGCFEGNEKLIMESIDETWKQFLKNNWCPGSIRIFIRDIELKNNDANHSWNWKNGNRQGKRLKDAGKPFLNELLKIEKYSCPNHLDCKAEYNNWDCAIHQKEERKNLKIAK